jgi:hypothetical protein
MPAAVDITGQRYGRLVALSYVGYLRSGSQPKRAFRFICDCGKEVIRTLMDVRRLDTVSCGCHKRERAQRLGLRSRLTEGESSFRSLLYAYRRRAKLMGIAFSLSADAFRELTSASCVYCNAKPSQTRRANVESFGVYRYNGIDRLDSSGGYEHGNVAPCCAPCNRAKGTMDRHDFLDLVRRIYRWSCED